MSEFTESSVYFAVVLTLAAYLLGVWLKQKTRWAFLNPLLFAILFIMLFLVVFGVEYGTYEKGTQSITYLLTPATVCLAIPLYKQLEILKQNLVAVLAAIVTGVLGSAASIFVLARCFGLSHIHYVTLLPKSITTAIGMGVSEEAGGIVTLTVASIVVTGILGNMVAEFLFRVVKIEEPIAKGLALGTAAHAVGTAKALELGEVEGAMSSLSIAVAGLVTVVVVPMVSNLI